MVERITGDRVDLLFGLHRTLHDGVMGLERVRIVGVRGKNFLLDALTQTIVRHEQNDLLGVLFLRDNPTGHLIHGEQIRTARGMQFLGLDHALADGFYGQE